MEVLNLWDFNILEGFLLQIQLKPGKIRQINSRDSVSNLEVQSAWWLFHLITRETRQAAPAPSTLMGILNIQSFVNWILMGRCIKSLVGWPSSSLRNLGRQTSCRCSENDLFWNF